MFARESFPLNIESGLPLRCPAFTLCGLVNASSNEALLADIESLAGELRSRWSSVEIGQIEGIAPVRASYRALGIDPTKTRPSSEALLRRILKGQELYRVNVLVDALNYCSLRYLVPFGLYDLDRVRVPVSLRSGQDGEGYPGIRKDRVNVSGRPCLSDVEGPFGNPTSDSDRTKITLDTTRVLVAPFLPENTPDDLCQTIVDGTAATLTHYAVLG